MVYAQFYHESTGWNGKDFSGPVQNIEMCGGDGVFLLPGKAMGNVHNVVLDQIKKLANVRTGIKGYKVMKGQSFTDAKPISGYIAV